MNNLFLYLSLVILFYLVAKRLLDKVQNLPPSPFITLPILGHLYLLKTPLHRTLANLSRTYGPVLYLRFGSRPVLLISSPSAAEQCLHQNDVVFANRPSILGGQILGYNNTILVWAPYGDHWRNLRRILTVELLSSHRLQLMSAVRHDEVRSLIGRLQTQASGGEAEVEMKTALFDLTYRVMMRMIAGDQSCKGDNKGVRFRKVLEEIYVVGGLTNVGDFLPFLSKIGVKGLEKTFVSIHQKSDQLLQEMVQGQRSKMGEGNKERDQRRLMNDNNNSNKAMIQVLLELQEKDPEYYTDEIIKGLILVILIAGTDTSAMTMEWALSLLLNNPIVFQKAQAEIDDQVGFDCLISESNLANLPYLHCIINETLRMYPPAPLTPHESSKDCIVEGYHMPRGTMLFVNLWAIQNDPKMWHEPRRFKPERFEGIKGNRMEYKSMPFGSGRRGCPGETLAIRMIGLTLGALIQCFELERIVDKLVDMEEGVGLTMPKAKPLIIKIRPRQKAFKILSQISN